MSAEKLIDLARELAALGYCPGGAGNVSCRSGSRLLITRSGVDLGRLDEADLVTCDVDWQARRVTGGGKGASKEIPMHLALHARRLDVDGYVGHVHSPLAGAVACLGSPSGGSAIPALTPYFVMKVGEVPLVGYAEPGSQEQAERMFELPDHVTTVLLQNHGLSSHAADPEQVLDRIREAEITSGVWLQVKLHPDVRFLNEREQLTLTNKYRGNSEKESAR